MSRSIQKQFFELYAELEQGVQELVTARCRAFCELCTSCCCRAEICEEAISSPFLRTIHRREVLDSDGYGFLDTGGCSLQRGRPPICYEFFCDELMAAQEDDLNRDVLRALGRLLSLVGERALGSAHLVELADSEQLERVDFEKMEKRIRRALESLEVIREFYSTGRLDVNSHDFLIRIEVTR